MFCKKCGAELKEGQKFCVSCGTPVSQVKPAVETSPPTKQVDEPKKKKNSIALIAGVLGVLALAAIVVILAVILILRNTNDTNDSDDTDAGWDDMSSVAVPEKDEQTDPGNDDKTDVDQADGSTTDLSEETGTTHPDEEVTASEDAIDQADAQPTEQSTIHRYDIIIDDVSWYDAQNDCMDRGGHLVTFDSEEELKYVLNMIDERMEDHYNYYVGARRKPEVYEYRWQNQQGLPYGDSILPDDCEWIHSYWLKGEPTFLDENGNDECYMDLIYVKEKWVLNDIPGDITEYYPGKVAYVIEWDE